MKQVDIYTRVTQQIIAAIEKGKQEFRLPWHVTDAAIYRPLNAATQRPYRGINSVSLWVTALEREYSSGFWGTYRQWQELGAQVRRGEKATEVVLWKPIERDRSNTTAQDEGSDNVDQLDRGGLVARGFSVFNVAQVDGFAPLEIPQLTEEQRITSADSFFQAIPADVRHGGKQAFYSSAGDFILLPEFRTFRRPGFYYTVRAHETMHWTGAPQRLNRQLKNRFGSLEYAAEELIAELGAAFLAARLNLFAEPRKSHAAYIGSWLELLHNDKRAIFTAASKAQQGVDWLCELAAGKQAAA